MRMCIPLARLVGEIGQAKPGNSSGRDEWQLQMIEVKVARWLVGQSSFI